jgi:hypothetical protein
MARSYHVTTGTGAVAATLINGASDYLGIVVATAETTPFYIKLWWSGNTNVAPTVGTTIPKLTIEVPTTGLSSHLSFPLNNGGLLYWWASTNAADTDSTALVVGGDVITIIFD